MRGAPKVLILVECAGTNPWLDIEEEAQRPILEDWFVGVADLAWISGTPDGDGNNSAHKGVRHIRRQLKITGKADSVFSRLLRLLIGRYNLHALGERSARKFFYEKFVGASPRLDGSRIWLPYPTQIHIAGLRTIETFRYALSHYEFDFAVRLSSTCLVRPNVLMQMVSTLPRKRVYRGVPNGFGRTTFMSGSSIILSRDVIEAVVANERHLSLSVYEDVALSLLIQRLDVADPLSLTQIEIQSPSDLPKSIESWGDVPIIRCKAESPTKSSKPVVENMLAVKNFVEKSGVPGVG